MKAQRTDKATKSTVKQVHRILRDQNIAQFLKAMDDFDGATGKGRKLHLGTNLIKMLAVSDMGSAANVTGGRSSSDISNAILMLEQFFGCLLKDQTSQSLRFNERGKELVRLTRSILISFAEFHQQCYASLPRYVIAAGDSILHLLLLPKLAQIQKQLPEVLFEVRDLGTLEIQDALRECRVDFALVNRDAVANLKNIESRSIVTYGYSVFCPRSLLSNESGDTSYLAAPFALSKHWAFDVLKMASEANMRINVRVWCENFSHVGRLIRLGSYAGVMPQFASGFFEEKEFLSVVPEFLKRTEQGLSLGWNRRLEKIRPALKQVAEVLEKELTSKV